MGVSEPSTITKNKDKKPKPDNTNEGGSKGKALYYQDLTLEKALNKLLCQK